jgi:ferredoxin
VKVITGYDLRELWIMRKTCPLLFEQDPDDSFSRIIEKYRINGNTDEGTLTDDLAPCAQEDSDLCPVQIISILECPPVIS